MNAPIALMPGRPYDEIEKAVERDRFFGAEEAKASGPSMRCSRSARGRWMRTQRRPRRSLACPELVEGPARRVA
jgi:hypothetical protein